MTLILARCKKFSYTVILVNTTVAMIFGLSFGSNVFCIRFMTLEVSVVLFIGIENKLTANRLRYTLIALNNVRLIN